MCSVPDLHLMPPTQHHINPYTSQLSNKHNIPVHRPMLPSITTTTTTTTATRHSQVSPMDESLLPTHGRSSSIVEMIEKENNNQIAWNVHETTIETSGSRVPSYGNITVPSLTTASATTTTTASTLIPPLSLSPLAVSSSSSTPPVASHPISVATLLIQIQYYTKLFHEATNEIECLMKTNLLNQFINSMEFINIITKQEQEQEQEHEEQAHAGRIQK
jgi:hypothetical protein